MFIHPLVDGPAIFRIGPIILPFYGLMYSLSYLICIYLGEYRLKKYTHFTEDEFDTLVSYLFFSIIVGARLGDILFYRLHYLVTSPWIFTVNGSASPVWITPLVIVTVYTLYSKLFTELPLSNQFFIMSLLTLFTGNAGMSFHGALIGGLLAILLYSYQFKKNCLTTIDFIAPLIPISLGLGRFANFINGELWGRPTEMPWGVIFPRFDFEIRHPSQLYECFLEGIVLFIVLWNFSKRPKPTGAISGLAMLLYALARIFVEFFRDPSEAMGFIAWGWLTMGQLLSFPMLIGGAFLLLRAYLHREPLLNTEQSLPQLEKVTSQYPRANSQSN
jgi:phosphatidylglycerol:prolipoprotein diacylglycerol transferase